jgi:hypothetical protein
VPDAELAGADARAARAAAKACPRRALLLVGAGDQASGEPPVTPRTWDVT